MKVTGENKESLLELNKRIMSLGHMIEAQIKLNKAIRPKWRKQSHSDYLSTDAFLSQTIIEMVELAAESGIEFKWWSKTPADAMNEWNVKIEAIDVLHFYMSAMVVGFDEILEDQLDPTVFNEHYLGVDVLSLLDESIDPNSIPQMVKNGKLQYPTFVGTIKDLLSMQEIIQSNLPQTQIKQLVFMMMNAVICSVNLTSLETSAVFTAKRELNQIRTSTGYKEGKYTKVKDGIEDNERLKPLVEAFLADESMTLAQLAKNVRNAFFIVN